MRHPRGPGSRCATLATPLALALAPLVSAQDGDAPATAATLHRQVPQTATSTEAARGRDRALDWLVEQQNEDGSWASAAIEGVLDSSGYAVVSFYDWRMGAVALATLALMEGPPTAERRDALDRALHWMCDSKLPLRGSDWDNDAIWADLYGFIVCLEAAEDPRFVGTALGEKAERRGREFLAALVRQQVPTGGWGYYDDPPYSRRPKWGTSFSTALVLPAVKRALEIDWLDDPRVLRRSVEYVRRCRLPNGAYEYDLRPIPRVPMGDSINDVKGSLSRIQVCQWSLRSCGHPSVTDERLRAGLSAFFRDHRFLDIARMRPVPHEAYYANAGYFYFFGHYYAAQAIQLLPPEERESWHARLRPHILKTLRPDGSCCDFIGQRYMIVADTAYAALTLDAGLAAAAGSTPTEDPPTPTVPRARLLDVRKIWDAAPHNAFTDLVRWRGAFWCGFREGRGHAGDQGSLRVIRSEDGMEWTSMALLRHPAFDLRDAGLSVSPDDRLYVIGGAQFQAAGGSRTGTFVSVCEDARSFSDPRLILPPGRWLWKLSWHQGRAWGVSYPTPDGHPHSSLLVGDGEEFSVLVPSLYSEGQPTEAVLRFAEDGTALCLHRRDGAENNALLGIASAPYEEWSFHDLGMRIGGPSLIASESGAWLAAGRLYDGRQRTELLHIDVEKRQATPILLLPSGGDTSYPGLVWHDDLLWISYYSSHEGKTSIYLARVAVDFAPEVP